MTVSNQSFRTLQQSDGVALVYNFDFHIQGQDATDWNSQIVVYENGVLTTITYTISAVTPAGGTITFDSAPAAGTLSIVRKKVNTQESSYPVGTPFPPVAVESSLDDLTLQTQDVEAIGEFGIRQPIWEVKRKMELPDIATRALRTAVFDQDGNVDVSDLVAVPIKILNCVVNFSGEPYNAVSGEADSTAAIQNALNSGANLVTGCPGIYNVNGLTIPSNVSLIAPGVTLNGITGTEGNFFALSDPGAAILSENIHVQLQALTGFDNIFVQNYINCSFKDLIIDGVFNGVTIGGFSNNGSSDMFAMENVIIRNCSNGGIRPTSGPNKNMNISFTNVGVELCSFRPIEFGTVNGSWKGGFVRNNTVSALRGAMEFNASNGASGFDLSGVKFKDNGNSTLDSMDIFVGKCSGLDIRNNRFENTITGEGRLYSVSTATNIAVAGMNITGNNVIASIEDDAAFAAIQVIGGPTNNFIASNVVDGLTGGQSAEVIDVTVNYHILNGVKQ